MGGGGSEISRLVLSSAPMGTHKCTTVCLFLPSHSGDIDPERSVLVGCTQQRCWDCQRKYTVLVWNPGVLRQRVKFGHYSCNTGFMPRLFLRGVQREMKALVVKRITLEQLPVSVKNAQLQEGIHMPCCRGELFIIRRVGKCSKMNMNVRCNNVRERYTSRLCSINHLHMLSVVLP